jgi:hypothetical protein
MIYWCMFCGLVYEYIIIIYLVLGQSEWPLKQLFILNAIQTTYVIINTNNSVKLYAVITLLFLYKAYFFSKI